MYPYHSHFYDTDASLLIIYYTVLFKICKFLPLNMMPWKFLWFWGSDIINCSTVYNHLILYKFSNIVFKFMYPVGFGQIDICDLHFLNIFSACTDLISIRVK